MRCSIEQCNEPKDPTSIDFDLESRNIDILEVGNELNQFSDIGEVADDALVLINGILIDGTGKPAQRGMTLKNFTQQSDRID